MKPSVRDMHAAMVTGGEECLDAREVFSDLGVLIVEGRVPGGQHAGGRGYGEGPHCPKPTPCAAVARHDCDASFLCQRAENLHKHLQLLWQNNVPLCIEVLLCSECPCGAQKATTTDVANVASPSDLLLEQWLVTMVPVTKRCVEPPPITVRGLFQAVRSQLHFSQLSAWWSSSQGGSPAHVSYRVTVPGEAFASQFRSPPQLHSFPLACVSRGWSARVCVRTAPRTGFVPLVACALHAEDPEPPRCASPPSPAPSPRPRRGRQGLARRRDVAHIPGVVDDRLHNPCNRPGKHHCRCAYEEDSEPFCPAGDKEFDQTTETDPFSYRSESPTRSKESCSKPPEAKRDKRPRKESGCDAKPTKLNLELSRREFEEVLSVLRDRNGGPSSHHGAKVHSRSSGNAPSSKCQPDQKSPPSSDCNPLVYNLQPPSLSKPAPTGKAELFMEAILRTSDNNSKNNNAPLGKAGACDEVSALSRQLSKISVGKDNNNSCGVLDACGGSSSGAKRKRFDFKTELAEETLHDCDNVGNKNLGDSLFVFDDNLPCDGLLKGLALQCELTGKPDQGDFECLSPTIDERALASVPRTNRLHKRRCDVEGSDVAKCVARERDVPSAHDKAKFRRSLDTAASLVFHSRTGLPLTSSPAPVRRNATCFDFDSSINCVSAIRSALFETATPPPSDDSLGFSSDDAESEGRSPCSPKISLPPVRCCWSHYTHLASSLLGTFEESVLNGRLEPVSTVQGFTANLGASGSFCPRHVTLPITVFFYTLGDNDKVSTPYLAHINLGKKGYNVPRCGTIQVTLFNPMGTVVKMFVVMYDLADMPANSHTFLRQRTLYMPAKTASSCQPGDFQKWLRYLIHLRFTSSKSGRIYLHTDIRMIIFRKSDLDTATAHGVEDVSYELRSFTQGPTNPKFSSRK